MKNASLVIIYAIINFSVTYWLTEKSVFTYTEMAWFSIAGLLLTAFLIFPFASNDDGK